MRPLPGLEIGPARVNRRMHMQGYQYDQGTRYIDRREWSRFLFYTDLIVITIMVISTVLLVVNAYTAGYQLQMEQYAASHNTLWKVAASTAFLVGSMAWVFFRFFKNQYLAMKRPF